MHVGDPSVHPVPVPPVIVQVPGTYAVAVAAAVNVVVMCVLSVQVPPLEVQLLTLDPLLPLTVPLVWGFTVSVVWMNETLTVVSVVE